MMISSSTPQTNPMDTSPTSSNSGTAVSNENSPNNLASEDTFLQLFVAQLQNQDPLNPNEEDPTQMVSELAQFSQLEQLVNIGEDVQSIDQTVTGSAPSDTSQQASSGTDSNSGTTPSQSS